MCGQCAVLGGHSLQPFEAGLCVLPSHVRHLAHKVIVGHAPEHKHDLGECFH